METDPTRAIEWMIGLPAVRFLGCEDGEARIHIEMTPTPVGCPGCGVLTRLKERSRVELVDLGLFGRPARLVGQKRRWHCADPDCTKGSWTEEDHRIAAPRQVLTARAARWATLQVGRHARSVNEVAGELGCDWHTVNDTVLAYGQALLEADTERIDEVRALGLDEVLMVRVDPYRRQEFSTQLVDVDRGQLLDIVPGRGSAQPMGWLAERGPAFRDRIEYGALDLSGPYRRMFEIMVPHATLVADLFHVCKLANTKLVLLYSEEASRTRERRPFGCVVEGISCRSRHTHHLPSSAMEFWAQRTVSPFDGRLGWTVVDDTYVEHQRAAAWLRALIDAQGRSAGTARAYAGRLALYLTWSGRVRGRPV